MTTVVQRHRTAMHRAALSRPIALALQDGLIDADRSVFDYGCGRGGDLRRLRELEIHATGWDPKFAPTEPRREADVINLGYVVNVIEDPTERTGTLVRAWALAQKVLVVATRLEWEAGAVNGRVHGDGLVTSKGTFQKLFRQDELRDWIQESLSTKAVAAAPGIFYVFRDNTESQQFLARRFRGREVVLTPNRTEELYEANRAILDELASFVSSRGRLPRDAEIMVASDLTAVFGSIQRAFAVLRRVIGTREWEQVGDERRRDLLVYLALANFGGRPPFSQLPQALQYDVRDFFGSYTEATKQSDKLLFAVGDLSAVDASMRAALVGKLTPEAHYVHVSALQLLPPILRVYEGCARALSGTVDDATVLKMHRQKHQVSYLCYPGFDKDPHPALSTVIVARLSKIDIDFKDFRSSSNPPILHRKECFVGEEYESREKFMRLTHQEERAGLLGMGNHIGTRNDWQALLKASGYRLAGHRLVSDKSS